MVQMLLFFFSFMEDKTLYLALLYCSAPKISAMTYDNKIFFIITTLLSALRHISHESIQSTESSSLCRHLYLHSARRHAQICTILILRSYVFDIWVQKWNFYCRYLHKKSVDYTKTTAPQFTTHSHSFCVGKDWSVWMVGFSCSPPGDLQPSSLLTV